MHSLHKQLISKPHCFEISTITINHSKDFLSEMLKVRKTLAKELLMIGLPHGHRRFSRNEIPKMFYNLKLQWFNFRLSGCCNRDF